ncbi:ki-ras-induced actin-interacting protein-IP3R-interacting domain olf186-M isoform X4 [Temnothorax americanus]|uniref:ki-ras-induced actin-interacting protein-IP3R-interacting domain olf186-M isoform X4 n=1 Tax=Temnothorax americanus TaxID=1964332 RepID=UPI0040693DE6
MADVPNRFTNVLYVLSENVGKETILKVTDWLRGIWEMRRRASGPVQQWIDSIPSSARSDIVVASECQEDSRSHEHKPLTPTEPKDIPFSKDFKSPSMTVSAPINVPNSPAMNTPILPCSLPHQRLARDASFQSDSSHCSSVESLLELRRADPAAILLDLGFGGSSASPRENGTISRIPRRFLQPSTLPGIAIDDFLKQQQETTESFDSVSLGYRGLMGSPYVAPSEIVQKIMERLREHESHEADTTSLYNCDQHSSLQMDQNGKLSVLSPNNRQFLEQPRSKSPDMRNKRMIIGQKSFAFGYDGNLIEIPTSDTNLTCDTVNDHNSSLDTSESIELKQSSPEGSITFEHQYFSKYDKKLAKQLSFDDTVDFPETDQLSKDDQGSQNSLTIAQSGANLDDRDQEYDSSDTTSKRHEFSDTRRASDGSCDIKPLKNKTFYGRRFSDGAMRQSKEHTLTQKRRSFKRQSRVCDITAMHYCDLSPIRSSIPSIVIIEPNVDKEVSSDSTLLNIPKSFESTEDKSDLELKIDTESSFSKPNNMPSPSNVSESIDRLECSESAQEDSASSDHSCTEDNQACCYKGIGTRPKKKCNRFIITIFY